MQPLRRLALIALSAAALTACGAEERDPSSGPEDQASLKRLELRVNQLERQLKELDRPASTGDSKTPAGPLRSLTLRTGTNDDRLRMYWSDGQTSDLVCSQEGKGIWACG